MESARIDGYLFESAHGALTFAYRFSGQQFSPSAMAILMRGAVKAGKGLGGLDGAGQAGLIRGLMDGLDPYERHMIEARFEMNEAARIKGMLYLLPMVMANMPDSSYRRRAADVMVQRWFGRHKLRFGKMCEEIGCHRNTGRPLWMATNQVLDAIWQRAEMAAHSQLQAAGITP